MPKYFNEENFIILGSGNQILYRKPTINEVYQMIINEEHCSLINESVFKNNIFENLLNYVNKNEKDVICFNTEKLKDYFPIKSKVFRILSKNKNRNNYKLYIVKYNFNSKEDVKHILEVVCDFQPSNVDVNLIYNDIKNSSAMFTPLKKSKEFGILWIYKNISSLNDFKHEFIHYLEWIDGIYGKNINFELNEDNEYFKDQDLFMKIFHLDDSDLDYIFDRYEYETLLNDFLNILVEIKKMYFQNLTEYDFAKRICYDLKKVESNKEYLNRIKNIDYFQKYFNSDNIYYSLMMIIGYFCMNYKIMNIKNHIFGNFDK